MRHKFQDKRAWVLARLQAKHEEYKRTHCGHPMRPFICASDEDEQEAWRAAFGGKEVIY